MKKNAVVIAALTLAILVGVFALVTAVIGSNGSLLGLVTLGIGLNMVVVAIALQAGKPLVAFTKMYTMTVGLIIGLSIISLILSAIFDAVGMTCPGILFDESGSCSGYTFFILLVYVFGLLSLPLSIVGFASAGVQLYAMRKKPTATSVDKDLRG